MTENINLTAEEQEALDAFVAMNQNRANMYKFLARAFAREADADFLSDIRAMRLPVSTGNENVDKGNKLLATFMCNRWENTIMELRVDFTHTFIGSGVDALGAAYPSESVYTSEKRLFMQEARDEVLSIYRSEGYGKREGWKEDEDHISAEMEFMAAMIDRMIEAIKQGDDATADNLMRVQQNFLDDHLGAWAPMFTEEIRKFTRTKFYEGLSYITDGFLESDAEFMAEALQEDEPEEAMA